MSLKTLLKKPLYLKLHREYKKEIASRQMTYEQYMETLRLEAERPGPGKKKPKRYASSEVKSMMGDILFLTSSSGTIDRTAREKFAKAFIDNPNTMIAYCDIFEGDTPILRPDWSPDRFLECFYFRGLVAIRSSLCNLKCGEDMVPDKDEEFSEAMLWSLCYRILKTTDAFGKRNKKNLPIVHVPEVLFRTSALPEYIGKEHLKGVTEATIKKLQPSVSVVIPSKDQPILVKKCITSLLNTSPEVKEGDLEIIVVDNGSSEENKKMTEKLSKELGFKYIYEPQTFNFAKMCNLGAENASKDFLLFLNDDIECTSSGWLGSMMELAAKPRIGTVGLKLLYPDLTRIQHAGISNLPIGPVHKLQFFLDENRAYDNYNHGIRDVLAVTGACLMMRRAQFVEFGGFKEQFAVAFNDVELCFRLYDAGFYNVVSLDYYLIHHESASRGADESEEKWERLMQERKLLYSLHPVLDGYDPFYNEHLNRNGLDTGIRPAFETGVEIPDKVGVRDMYPMEFDELDKYRLDPCVHLRLEVCRDFPNVVLHGYGVVLGSDNSAFDTELLFRNTKDSSIVFAMEQTHQYRIDLVENMPDQVNVGLGGFAVEFGKNALPVGEYEVGMLASDRTSKLKLYWFTERKIRVGVPQAKAKAGGSVTQRRVKRVIGSRSKTIE